MSRAHGVVKMPTGEIRFFFYHGVGDLPEASTFASWTDLVANADEVDEKCACRILHSVDAFANYGGGFYFSTLVCPTHNKIHPIGPDASPRGYAIIGADGTDWGRKFWNSNELPVLGGVS